MVEKITINLRIGQDSSWMNDADLSNPNDKVRFKQSLRTGVKETFTVSATEQTSYYELDDLGNPLPPNTIENLISSELSQADDAIANQHYFLGEKIVACCHWEGDTWRKCEEYAVLVGPTPDGTGAKLAHVKLTDQSGVITNKWVPIRAMVSWHCETHPNTSPSVDWEISAKP